MNTIPQREKVAGDALSRLCTSKTRFARDAMARRSPFASVSIEKNESINFDRCREYLGSRLIPTRMIRATKNDRNLEAICPFWLSITCRSSLRDAIRCDPVEDLMWDHQKDVFLLGGFESVAHGTGIGKVSVICITLA